MYPAMDKVKQSAGESRPMNLLYEKYPTPVILLLSLSQYVVIQEWDICPVAIWTYPAMDRFGESTSMSIPVYTWP